MPEDEWKKKTYVPYMCLAACKVLYVALPVYSVKKLWPQWIYSCPHPRPDRPAPPDMWCPAAESVRAMLSMLFDIGAFPPYSPNEVLWSAPVRIDHVRVTVRRIHHQSRTICRNVVFWSNLRCDWFGYCCILIVCRMGGIYGRPHDRGRNKNRFYREKWVWAYERVH